MALEVQAMTITGTAEQIIRDNVVNPDIDLGNRALTELQKPFKGQTLGRARAAFQDATAAGTSGLPNYLDESAVIAWYLTRDDYKDATARANGLRIVQINNEIASRTSEKNRKQEYLNAHTGTLTAATAAALQAEIDAITAIIAALELEQADLNA